MVAASPWLDLTMSLEKQMEDVEDAMITQQFPAIAKALVGRDTRSSYYSPMFWTVQEMEQYPPLFISVSQSEKFVVETKYFAKMLKQTKELQYQIVDKYICVPHAYGIMGFIREGKETVDQMVRFIQSCTTNGQ